MALTNTLKEQVDLPVWEWLRSCPVSAANTTTMTTSDGLNDKFLYVLFTATEFWRYCTISDTWQKLASPLMAPVTPCSIKYATYNGYRGRVISNINSTSFYAAGLNAGTLNGYKIRIISGQGIGQERTITSVSEPEILDQGINTGATQTSVADTAKAWTANQYVNHQVRVILGTGASGIRKILYNNNNTLTWTDTNWGNAENRYFCPAPVLAANSSVYQIERSIFTIDTAWDVSPDSTSKFVILSGSVWLMAAHATTPFMTLQLYDVASDTWYQKTATTSVMGVTAAIATDISIERAGEVMGMFVSGNAHASTAHTYNTFAASATTSLSGNPLVPSRWDSFKLKIVAGPGIGQSRSIITTTSSGFTVNRAWEIMPTSASTYAVYGDSDKIFLAGLYDYSTINSNGLNPYHLNQLLIVYSMKF
jgi:hypothetical protein